MTSAEIRQSFLDFFREKQHTIVPSSSLLPDSPNLLFTNAGMNQFVPIFLGQQSAPWTPPRTADTQKCIRAGGKHNDLDDVGLDTYHHTFFEMLGNWSFGDYFKQEAIEWAWELVVERWGLPPQRLYATVYKPGADEPSEFDQEAHDHWARLFTKAGLDPAVQIVNGNKKDNFWMMGDNGPCGPCSELHIDLTPPGDTRGSLVNAGDPRCIEIWNLVFIQFNANPDGTFNPLPARHVDTGMGFERVAALIQGTKHFTDFSRLTSNYETDVFRPLFDEIEKLSGKRYGSTLPKLGSTGENEQEKIDVAFRVVADHIRTLSFAIADGIQPSNESRGYVLRRILRRAVRYGRTLGFHERFFYKLVDVVVATIGGVFPELREKQQLIRDTLRQEEETFNKTLDRGIALFDELAEAVQVFPILADTAAPHVFALEQVISDPGVVDFEFAVRRHSADLNAIRAMATAMQGYSVEGLPDEYSNAWTAAANVDDWLDRLTSAPAMIAETRDQFREDVRDQITGLGSYVDAVRSRSNSIFPGEAAFYLYDTFGFPLDLTELMARERGLTVDVAGFEKLMEQQRSRARAAQKKETIEIDATGVLNSPPTRFVGYDSLEIETSVCGAPNKWLIVEQTPFYAEMGGQVSDSGHVVADGRRWNIRSVRKAGDGVFVHWSDDSFELTMDTDVRMVVDKERRHAIERHHTATHLLHWALHELVSREAAQKGSYVGPEKLTFDFSSAALTHEQIREVEKLVNERIAQNAPVSWTEVPYAEAKKRSDIQQFFGDKYGDLVRVVQIGGEPQELNGYSMELCGGTHVRATGDIRRFKIVSESAIAAGIRRIEAVAGDEVITWAENEVARQQEKFEMLAKKKHGIAAPPSFAKEDDAAAAIRAVESRAAYLKQLEAEVHEWEKQHAKAAEADLRSRAVEIAGELMESHSNAKACVSEIPNADGALLQAVADILKTKINGPIVLAGSNNGRVDLVTVVPKDLSATVRANEIIQAIAPLVGGKGGGRPDSARGAGKDPSKIEEALAHARTLVGSA